MSEPKTVHRYPPCPDYDIEAMESWLSDMAAKGLVLTRDGFFFGFGIFEKTEPKTMRYRLEASKYRSGTLNEFNPPEEAQELYEAMGWQYVAARGNFHIYCTDDPEARELHTDPHVQAMNIDAARKRIRNDIIFEVVWIILMFGFYLGNGVSGTPLLLAVLAFGTPASLLFLVLLSWTVAEMFRRFAALNRLRKRMHSGELLSHNKDWRKGRAAHIAGIIVNWILTLTLAGVLISSCTNAIDNKNEIPLEEFKGTIPFATMKDFLPDCTYEQDKSSIGRELNHIELRSDVLAPLIIEYTQNGELNGDDIHFSGGLGVTYIEARNEWLAKELVREFIRNGRGSKHYKLLELSLEGVDHCEAFIDIFPTVVLRKGNTVVRADFYYVGRNEDDVISLEQWAGTIAASIAG